MSKEIPQDSGGLNFEGIVEPAEDYELVPRLCARLLPAGVQGVAPHAPYAAPELYSLRSAFDLLRQLEWREFRLLAGEAERDGLTLTEFAMRLDAEWSAALNEGFAYDTQAAGQTLRALIRMGAGAIEGSLN